MCEIEILPFNSWIGLQFLFLFYLFILIKEFLVEHVSCPVSSVIYFEKFCTTGLDIQFCFILG